jgi:microsomal epoxide hydrolase
MMRHVSIPVWSILALALVAGGTSSPGLAAGQPDDDEAVRPFTIAVPDAVLDDLRDRLARTRFPDEIEGAGWDYGTNRGYLRELVTYWRDTFDWRAQERRLNAFDQYKTRIDGLDLHFVHQRSPEPGALAIVLLHGWPGSFVEFSHVIGALSDPVAHGGRAEDAFHVVAVSLPGYGFSDRPRERGFAPERMAAMVATLMDRLGYATYGVQGGDWGSVVGRFLALNDSAHVAGLHLNFCQAGPPAGVDDPNAGVLPAELERMRARQAFFAGGRAYFDVHATKPQSLGYGLNDSPAGLAAWIVEKFQAWCDCDGDIEQSFTKDDLLTNLTLYWVTETITSSTRIYYENQRAPGAGDWHVEVPTACAVFPGELAIPPRAWVAARFNLARWTEMPRGGHFAALEEPELLVDDMRAFFQGLR